MQRLFSKDSDQTSADSLAPLFGNHSSLSYSAKQPHHSLSKKLASDLETAVKQSNSRYQGHDLSSSLPTSKSHHEPTTLARSNLFMQNIAFKPGFSETYKKNGEDYIKPSLPCGNADQINHQVQMEHNQSLGCISYPLAEPYMGRIFSAYGPNSAVFPQVMEFTPARAVVPLDRTEGMPIYVNAKQYQAILRRRQTRAKLEAQNKLTKSRKPYLHESRHLHAMKRARGSGGRFLNTQNMPQSKLSSQLHGMNISLEQVNGDASEPDIQHSQSNSWGTSTTSSSAISCIFNSDDHVFQQPKFRASSSSFPMGATACIGAYSHATTPDDRLLLSMDTCARISTADCVV